MKLYCDICHQRMTGGKIYKTLVLFNSPDGHNHDDNCLTKEYKCPDGHTKLVSKRRRCPKCNWMGRVRCWCHDGRKVDEWYE